MSSPGTKDSHQQEEEDACHPGDAAAGGAQAALARVVEQPDQRGDHHAHGTFRQGGQPGGHRRQQVPTTRALLLTGDIGLEQGQARHRDKEGQGGIGSRHTRTVNAVEQRRGQRRRAKKRQAAPGIGRDDVVLAFPPGGRASGAESRE